MQKRHALWNVAFAFLFFFCSTQLLIGIAYLSEKRDLSEQCQEVAYLICAK